MKKYQLFIGAILSFCALSTTTMNAQNGDQILDGIGETGLIARYVFDGDAKDWSRNNLHGKISDTKAKFVNDEQFGTVLSLPADSKAFVSIPADGLLGEESLTISGWIILMFRLETSNKGKLFNCAFSNSGSGLISLESSPWHEAIRNKLIN